MRGEGVADEVEVETIAASGHVPRESQRFREKNSSAVRVFVC
jgi:hypothetical protein